MDNLIKDTLGSNNIFGRFYIIWQWLAVLNKVHNEYKSDNRLLPTQEQFLTKKKNYDQQIKEIINDGYQSTTKETIEFEQALGSDVSEIRQTNSAINIEDNLNIYQDIDNDQIIENESEVAVPYSLVTKRPECDEDIDKMRIEEIIKATSKITFSQDNDLNDKKESNDERMNINQLQSTLTGEPINEFTKDDYALSCTFPYVFILGKAYKSTASNWNDEKKMHLLMQFSKIPSRDKLLLAYLFDLCKRHESINGICAHVKNKPGTIKKFGKLVKDKEFLATLEIAKSDPEGKEAKNLLNTILPILQFAG